ncbi:MAG: hypothetical protein AMXMBFR47_24420 [Planctomycetota bacterium]
MRNGRRPDAPEIVYVLALAAGSKPRGHRQKGGSGRPTDPSETGTYEHAPIHCVPRDRGGRFVVRVSELLGRCCDSTRKLYDCSGMIDRGRRKLEADVHSLPLTKSVTRLLDRIIGGSGTAIVESQCEDMRDVRRRIDGEFTLSVNGEQRYDCDVAGIAKKHGSFGIAEGDDSQRHRSSVNIA